MYEFNEILRCIKEYSDNRKIAILGYGDFQIDLVKFLKENDVEISFFIESSKAEIYDNVKTFSYYKENCKSSEYYLVVTNFYNASTYALLDELGLQNEKDYVYPVHEPLKAKITGNYTDEYGNKVIFSDNDYECPFEFNVVFKGYNSVITIGKSPSSSGPLIITADSDSVITVGDKVSLRVRNEWNIFKNAKLKIENNASLTNGYMGIMRDASVEFGENTALGNEYFLIAHLYTRISIGKNCCLGTNLMLRTNDGHTIFDIKTGNPTNVSYETNKKIHLVISDHVWIGTRVVVVGNSFIGKGSVIGACSLVKGKIPNNCVAVGTPAKVKKKDIAWCRENYADDIRLIPDEYIGFTDENF